MNTSKPTVVSSERISTLVLVQLRLVVSLSVQSELNLFSPYWGPSNSHLRQITHSLFIFYPHNPTSNELIYPFKQGVNANWLWRINVNSCCVVNHWQRGSRSPGCASARSSCPCSSNTHTSASAAPLWPWCPAGTHLSGRRSSRWESLSFFSSKHFKSCGSDQILTYVIVRLANIIIPHWDV